MIPLISIIPIALILLTLFWWTDSQSEVSQNDIEEHEHVIALSEAEVEQAQIKVQRAHPGVIEECLLCPGKVQLNHKRQAFVVPKISGIVVEVLVQPGDLVQEGQPIAIVDSKEIAEAKARYIKALREEEITQAIYHSEKSLDEKKIIAKHDLWQAEKVWEEADLELSLSKQNLRALGLNQKEISSLSQDQVEPFSRYAVKSPINGSVIRSSLMIGDVVDKPNEAFLIADLDTLWVELNISPNDITRVKAGQQCAVTPLKGDVETLGRIVSVTPAVDQKTRVGKAFCEIHNEGKGWVPGAFVNGKIITAQTEAPVVILREAIKSYEGTEVVFVKTENGFEAREVCIGKCDAKHAEIMDQINSGEEYVTENAFILKAELSQAESGG